MSERILSNVARVEKLGIYSLDFECIEHRYEGVKFKCMKYDVDDTS